MMNSTTSSYNQRGSLFIFLLILISSLFEMNLGLSSQQYDEALKVINKTQTYMPDPFMYLQWQPLMFYDINEIALQVKVYGFLTWVTKYSDFPHFDNVTILPDTLELALFPPFLESVDLWTKSSNWQKIANKYPAVTYLSKVGWVTVKNAYSLTMRCKTSEGTYYPNEEYDCSTEFIASYKTDVYCLNMKNQKAIYSCPSPTYHDCTVNTNSMKYFNKTSKNEKLIRKWEPISIKMEQRWSFNRRYLTFLVRMRRNPTNHVAIDAVTGFVAALAAIFQCLIPCSCKERLTVGLLSFLIYTSSLPALEELTPVMRRETCPLLHFYLLTGFIQVISFVWSVVATTLWYKAGKRMRESEEFQLMPAFTAPVTAFLAKITFASHLIESPEAVLAKMTRFHNKQLAKLYETAAEKESDENKNGKVEFSDGANGVEGTSSSSSSSSAVLQPDANLRHWHIFCLLVDRLLFVILIVMLAVAAGIFLS